MRFTETLLKGVVLVESSESYDQRGSFFRSFCAQEFASHDLPAQFVQCGISRNTSKGTLRGMHFQREPKPEAKLVRCIKGGIYDVIVDLRRDSITFCKWIGVELDETKATAICMPSGVAHGFLTLSDDAQILYQMTEYYSPDLAAGVRWDDPAFGIVWPAEVKVIADRDNSFPDFH